MKDYIKKLLREGLNEVNFVGHPIDRIKERFNVFNDEDIPGNIKQLILKNLDILKSTDFPTNKSYGVMIGAIPINKESQYYKAYLETVKDGNVMGKGGSYYSIMGDKGGIIKDSTGNQFWVVVRNNEVTTFMLRKDVQTNNSEYNSEKLRVDDVIKNLEQYINKKNQSSKPNTNRFKKIKLSDGNVIRHYEALNKFETLQGEPLEVDNIFDSLPEDLQVKVMELMESIELPVEIGDTVLMGKFKNKKVIVKDIEWDEEKGDLKINGKPALKMRLIKKLDDKENDENKSK